MRIGVIATLLAALLAVRGVAGQQSQEARPPSEATLRVTEAARVLAKTVASEGTPEFSLAFRRALALAEGVPTRTELGLKGVFLLGSMDFDGRYQQNLSAIIQGQRKIMGIEGGEEVGSGDFPETVAVTGNNQICTGVVVARSMVMTAGHCVCRGVRSQVSIGDSVAGAVDTVAVASAESMIPCSAHPREGDVGILRLARNVSVPLRPFASESRIDASRSVRLVGFGTGSDPRADPAGTKRMVDVPIASVACSGHVRTPSGLMSDAAFYQCAAGAEMVAGARSLNKDSCNGDSGGPAFVVAADGNLYLAATTSRPVGGAGIRLCGDGGIYVRSNRRILDWLRTRGAVPTVR